MAKIFLQGQAFEKYATFCASPTYAPVLGEGQDSGANLV